MDQASIKLINLRPLIAGIEFAHAVVICLAFVVLFFVTQSFLFVLVVGSALYLASRVLVAKKPRNWLEDAIAYQFGAKVYPAIAERRGSAR